MGFHVGQCVSTKYSGETMYGVIISRQDENYDILLRDCGKYTTINRKPNVLKEESPHLLSDYERILELLHIWFDWVDNDSMTPYYHVAILKTLQYYDFLECLKIKEREDFLDYIEDYLFDKEYTQCVVYFGDIVGETEFEKSVCSRILFY